MPGVIAHYKNQYELDAIRHVVPETAVAEVLYDAQPPLAYLTLNRPERRNAFNDAMYTGLLAGLHRALADDAVRVVVIKGAGLGFSAGHDLTSPKQAGEEPEETPPIPPGLRPTVADYFNIERRRCHKYEELLSYPKLLVAQVHGFCIGAGEFLQAACDFTYAAADAQFGTRGFGRATTGVASVESGWPGGSQASRGGSLLDELSGADAAGAGLINGAVPAARLDEEVRVVALRLAELPAEAAARAKQWYHHLWDSAGLGLAYRTHYEGHISIQWTRFRPGEVNFYKLRRDQGLTGYFRERAEAATPAGGA
jgi:enoyl-CoA hydratase/carnithine racemase